MKNRKLMLFIALLVQFLVLFPIVTGKAGTIYNAPFSAAYFSSSESTSLIFGYVDWGIDDSTALKVNKNTGTMTWGVNLYVLPISENIPVMEPARARAEVYGRFKQIISLQANKKYNFATGVDVNGEVFAFKLDPEDEESYYSSFSIQIKFGLKYSSFGTTKYYGNKILLSKSWTGINVPSGPDRTLWTVDKFYDSVFSYTPTKSSSNTVQWSLEVEITSFVEIGAISDFKGQFKDGGIDQVMGSGFINSHFTAKDGLGFRGITVRWFSVYSSGGGGPEVPV